LKNSPFSFYSIFEKGLFLHYYSEHTQKRKRESLLYDKQQHNNNKHSYLQFEKSKNASDTIFNAKVGIFLLLELTKWTSGK